MFSKFFYNATIKRIVSVFGTIFNNIHIARFNSGVVNNTIHVPISYGPQQKFLARIREEVKLQGNNEVAIKLPRMSFEITSISYNSEAKLNKMNKLKTGVTATQANTTFQGVPYTIGMQLNIYGKNQDDVLQIIEQILPTFTPEYVVTIKGIDGPDSLMDVPFILSGVSFQDDYEGDFNTRRAIIYTLDFEIKVKFTPSTKVQRMIKRVTAELADIDSDSPKAVSAFSDSPNNPHFSNITAKVGANESPSNNSPIATIEFVDPDDVYNVTFTTSPNFIVGDFIIGQTTGFGGSIKTISGGTATMENLEGLLQVGETVKTINSPFDSGVIATISKA